MLLTLAGLVSHYRHYIVENSLHTIYLMPVSAVPLSTGQERGANQIDCCGLILILG